MKVKRRVQSVDGSSKSSKRHSEIVEHENNIFANNRENT